MNYTKLEDTACALVAAGKGILAADESLPTIQKRFTAINIESTEENRRAYREMLFTTQGIEEFISGVILFDETIRQKTGDGTLFTDALSRKGIIPGIKVDTGTVSMPGHPDEKDHVRARWAPRAAEQVSGLGGPVRQVAGGDHDRSQHAFPCVHTGKCPPARALCRSYPRVGDGADRRARSIDGR